MMFSVSSYICIEGNPFITRFKIKILIYKRIKFLHNLVKRLNFYHFQIF